MASAAWQPSCRRGHRPHSHLLALALMLLAALAPCGRLLGFVASPPRRSGGLAALAARGGEEPAEANAAEERAEAAEPQPAEDPCLTEGPTEDPEPAPTAAEATGPTPWDLVHDPETQLRDLLARVYKPKDDSSGQLLEWTVEAVEPRAEGGEAGGEEGGEGGARAAFKVALTIPPMKASWSLRSQEGEEVEAAKAALARRVLSGRLGNRGDSRSTLLDIVQKALKDKRISVPTEAREGGGSHSTLELPKELFAGDAMPEGLQFEGEGSSKKESSQAASLQALLYICSYIALLPPLKALSDGITKVNGGKDPFRRGTNRVFLKYLSPETREETVREQLEQYGELTAFDLEEGQGSATYEHKLSAWAAAQMLDRDALDGRIISVEQEQQPPTEGEQEQQPPTEGAVQGGGLRARRARAQARRVHAAWQKSRRAHVLVRGRKVSPDAVLYYDNAPIDWSFSDMKKHFKEGAQAASFNYLMDPGTKKPLGEGSVGFESVEAAEEALAKLQDVTVMGTQLNLSFRPADADEAAASSAEDGADEDEASSTDKAA